MKDLEAFNEHEVTNYTTCFQEGSGTSSLGQDVEGLGQCSCYNN